MILAFSGASAVHADVISEEWIQAWRADLDFVKQTLPETHAQLFHTLSETDFNSAVEALSTRIPELSHHEIIVEGLHRTPRITGRGGLGLHVRVRTRSLLRTWGLRGHVRRGRLCRSRRHLPGLGPRS